jgi:hypothetical protein
LTLFWLNKDKVGLFHGSTCLLGPEDSKIRIKPLIGNVTDIEAGAPYVKEDNWTFKSWVKGEPISQMVKSQDRTNPAYRLDEPGFILSSLARSYYLTRFRSEEAVEALRAVAEAYVATALETKIKISGYQRLLEPLSSVVRNDPSQDLFGPKSTLFTRLGWTPKPIPQLRVAALVEDGTLRRILGESGERSQVENHLQTCLDTCPQVELDPGGVGELHEAALSVAAHALIHLFLRSTTQDMPVTKSNTDSVASQPFPLFYEIRTRAAFWEATFKLPCPFQPPYNIDRVVDLARLREAILKTAVGTKSRLLHPEATLAVSASGRTAIIAPIFDHSIEKEGILDVYLIPGNIRFQDMTIDNIVEDLDIEEHKPFPRLDVTAKIWNTIHHFSVEGSLLLMRTSIEYKASLESSQPQSGQWAVHYTKCVDDIARSIKINERRKDTLMFLNTRGGVAIAQIWVLVQSHFTPILEIENVTTRGRRLVEILPSSDHPRHVLVIDSSVTREILFFSCQADFRITKHLCIQGDASLEDCNWELLSLIFSDAVAGEIDYLGLIAYSFASKAELPASRGPLASPDRLAHRTRPMVTGKPSAVEVEEFSKSLISLLPSWTVVAAS